MCGVYPDADVKTAGDEISSTYEGRHVTLLESELIHPYHADGFVDKGDPVCFCLDATPTDYGWGVGIAFNSAEAASDKIAIDTEGIWAVQVYAEDDSGNVAVNVGDALYMRVGNLPGAADADGTGDGEVSKIRNLSTQVFFGYALGTIASGSDGVIAVKVHFSPEEQKDEFAILTGAAADDAKSYTVTDETAFAGAAYSRGLYINFTNAGVKSANGEANGLGIDINASENVTSMYAISLYTGACNGATINRVAGIYTYLDEPTGTVNAISCMHLETAASAATTNDFVSMRAHALQDGIFTFRSGGDNATYFLVFDPGIKKPVEAFNAAGNGDYSIKCYINGEVTYLHTYDAP